MGRTGRCHRFACVWVAVAWAVVPWLGEGAGLATVGVDAVGSRASAADGRLVHRFDFEEQELGNFESLPMHWYVVGRPADTADATFLRQPLHQELTSRPGHPRHSEVRFDITQSTSGRHSLYLGVAGGHTGAFLEVGAIPAVPGSDYLVTAMIRTDRLRRASASLWAFMVDTAGRRLPGTLVRCDPVRSDGRWTQVSMTLPGESREAAWIGMELAVLQPARGSSGSALGEREVVLQDVEGGAWFDDICLWQVPSVSVRSQSPVNVIRSPQRPRLSARVKDLSGRPMQASMTVYDSARRAVARLSQPVGDGEPTTWSWEPGLDRYGWYLVDLKLTGRGAAEGSTDPPPVARAIGAFVWLPQVVPVDQAEMRRFSLDAQSLGRAELEHVPELMDATGLGAVVLSAWDQGTTLQTLDDRQERLDTLVQSLAGAGKQVTLSLAPLPSELAQLLDTDADGSLWLFTRAREVWGPYLVPVLLRQGQRVRHWQLGLPERARAIYEQDLPGLVQRAESVLLDLTPQPRLVVPWRADQSRRRDLAPTPVFAIDVPPAVRPEVIGENLAEWRETPRAEYVAYLRETSAKELSQERRVDGMVLRMLRTWESGPTRLAVASPWTGSGDRHPTLLPDPVLGAFCMTASRLAGREVLGHMPLGDGLECLVLGRVTSSGPADGLLVAWNRSASPRDATLDMYLGPTPRAEDLWGNAVAVGEHEGRHRVRLGPSPIFIEGIDTPLALFRAAFDVEPGFLESSQAPRQVSVRIHNPFRRTISGYMTITGPETWSVQPGRTFFSIAAGHEKIVPLALILPASELAGPKRLTARFDFNAEQRYVVDLASPLSVGLPGIDFDASLSLVLDAATGRRDAIVTQMITNKRQSDLSLYSFASLSGFPRQERLVARLEPGQSVVRRFRFPDADAALTRHPLRVGIREASGPAMINQLLTLDRP